jgi:hypothetical protein
LAIGIRIKLPGVSQEQFDAAHDQINPDRSSPPGMLFHASGPIDGGWGVIAFWESRADFDAFLEGRIQPGIAASGVQMQGRPTSRSSRSTRSSTPSEQRGNRRRASDCEAPPHRT